MMKLFGMNGAATAVVAAMMFATPVFSADTGALPAEMTQNGLRYVTGGIGADAVAAFKQAAPKYPLELLFAQKATPNDVYLADVKVMIRQSGKVMLDAKSGGPFLLVQLLPGKYQIEASSDGVMKQQVVELTQGVHKRVVFVWDAPGGVAK
jgi:hypothetical protein